MATTKTIVQKRQIQNNTPPDVSVNVTVEAVVKDGVLVVSDRNLNPGVFTAGTVNEGSVNNPQQP